MKKLFLFTLICSLGFFTACSDDDDNDTPTPTPPEVNLAKEIEGLYNADLFLTYESAQDTSDQTINFFPQGKDYVKLKTSNINYKIGKNTIGSIEIDSIPVANSFSKAADHNIYFKITNKKVTLSKLGEMTANGNGSIGGGAIQFQLKLQNTDLTVDLNFKGRQTMNDQPEILKNHSQSAAHQGDLPLGDVAHGEAVDHHPAPGGHQLAGQELDDGGLAAAGGAHQEHELPVLYLEGNSV